MQVVKRSKDFDTEKRLLRYLSETDLFPSATHCKSVWHLQDSLYLSGKAYSSHIFDSPLCQPLKSKLILFLLTDFELPKMFVGSNQTYIIIEKKQQQNEIESLKHTYFLSFNKHNLTKSN